MLNPNNNFEHADLAYLPPELHLLLPFARKRLIPKGGYLIEEGIVSHYFFLVVDGIFRTFRTIDSEEYITGFTFPGDIDGSAYSFFNAAPANETIQAITEAKILVFYKADFTDQKRKDSALEDFILKLLSNYINILQNRLLEHQSITAEERYLLLLKQQPIESARIPLTYIASFLGISRERLSRIRKLVQV
ncbi:Crp/Fnr family transcriptional regulator [Pedobacter caeni]|uniref:cAMP-binding domain of CRP or a regulatory subunit of cAMP-dependent protein kinases n=1 Tax=Pedobacter caeni TaxID=288992 RepID=A0A1M4T1X9_9SPHI|nr:Crp/Fnr family transcriptional regulator [Pedobacter caeni]SHE38473.1 cAMP-binding domain of CRP or a regulatory subunit of cAMP-dependent protein kinases [Pedobacter caeni]